MKRISAILTLLALLISSTACNNTDDLPVTTSGITTPASDESVVSTDTPTAPAASITTAEESDEPANGSDFSELELIGLFINENETENKSRYCIDTANWEELDDFDLFREIFFGNWGYGTMTYDDMGSMMIDDSRVCHLFFHGFHFIGFYRISENVYGFKITGGVGFKLFWIDRSSPDTIYSEWFYTNVYTNYSYPQKEDMENYKTPYAVKVNNDLFNTDDGFMSVFKLHEMSKKYDMAYDLLVNMSLSNSDGSIAVSHDDWYDFYNIYLISESEDKIVLETVLSDVWMKSEMLIPVICTLEKKDGKWVRNVEVKDLELSYHGE
ncbi:MAG: hypothetical protein K2J79_01875 [Ruminiclostridium sp.]|nr:hypothetical protein [Ruminiclostridium sp.]